METRLSGFADSMTAQNGLVISISGPPIDVTRGYFCVRSFDRCDFSYGEKREILPDLDDLEANNRESVLIIRFLDSGDLLVLVFTL